ncbi:annexin [Phaeodactylum tricornutum CCAP 1055/1]|jgi:hypothetical protein|uniref:Annexin n=2 Tax=Phaeodactylum tricornutum TaxID=2850 RepID=B5Y5D4_PHATC|nr:annexin [Phaeodactylum tricornutum CCAP 1055/1]ACI65638.1 annexin [Phaeodactylum tricornutum CCAP 1055/1]|eukprot:XP_002186168.1 annexin [Phaeodactylum tricornutum CCAP 1055/1]
MSIDLYPAIIHEGDLSPDSFGPEVDEICNEIDASCKGFGTNEKRLLKAMGSQSPETRCKVPLRYKELRGKELKNVMKSECGKRNFGTALQFLAVSPIEADCDMIKAACKGVGTNELLLFTILCGRSNTEVELLKKKYFEIHTADLGRVLDGELGGDLEKMIFNTLQAAEEIFDSDYHTEALMKEDAAKLYEMGQGKRFGTNEAGLFKILCARPPEYLKQMNLVYAEKYGFTLPKALETELNGHVKDAALYMIGMKLKPYETVANLIHRACKGFGTNELLLTSALIRYQPIMKNVMEAYIELYGETIEDRIKSECGGDYERILLEVLGAAE